VASANPPNRKQRRAKEANNSRDVKELKKLEKRLNMTHSQQQIMSAVIDGNAIRTLAKLIDWEKVTRLNNAIANQEQDLSTLDIIYVINVIQQIAVYGQEDPLMVEND